MARGRMLSRSISACEQLARVSLMAELLFDRLIAHADPEGRLRGSAWDIKTLCVPKRPEITTEVIPQLLEELAAAVDHNGEGLIVRYEVANEAFLYLPGWSRHQTIRRGPKGEGPSRLPPPMCGARATDTPGVSPRGQPQGSTPGQCPEQGSSSFRSFEISRSESDARARELPPIVDQFLGQFYATATTERRRQVVDQLRRALSQEGCPLSRRERVWATRTTLERAITETFATPMREADKAIVVVLRKLQRGRCNEVLPPGLAVGPEETPDGDRQLARLSEPWRDDVRGAPSPLGAVTARVMRALSAPPEPDTERAAARAWVSEDPARLAAIELDVDQRMAAEVHPRWSQLRIYAGVRAERMDAAILAAYRAHRCPPLQEVG